MQKKLIFALGAAVGYVVGTRTGRQGYEKLKRQARDTWQSPTVQRGVDTVEGFVQDKIPVAASAVSDVRHKLDDAASAPVSPTSPSTSTPAASTPPAND